MQRVAIARALVNNPDILLADEPTGALDTHTSVQIMELLKEVAKDRLVIMVTHNPELAEKYSTRIIKMLDGEIKDDCTPMVLCSDGEYRDMTYSANTAAIMAAKIDICVGLQKHYGQTLPIWVDGAECFDEENRKKLKTDRQLVLLCVTEDERLTVKK